MEKGWAALYRLLGKSDKVALEAGNLVFKMPAYLAIGHPAVIHRDDLIIEQRDALFMLRYLYLIMAI